MGFSFSCDGKKVGNKVLWLVFGGFIYYVINIKVEFVIIFYED